MTSHSQGPGTPGARSDGHQPRIWATGRQRPAFDLRTYLRVALNRSRAVASPALGLAAGRLWRFGLRVEEGAVRIPPHRLGRTGRFLPSHAVTGRRLRDTASLLSVAGEAARGAPPVEGMAFRGWDGAPAAPAPVVDDAGPAVPAAEVPPPAAPRTEAPRAPLQRPRRPVPLATPERAGADRDTLEAIRSLIHTTHVEPQHPARRIAAPPPQPTGAGALPELAPAEPAPRGPLFRAAGQVLGAATVGLLFPVGLAQAALALLRGEDLRLAP